ncbi:MAG: PrsW family intramembrane metalloprotease [bacterium]|nr:PrsW family intramembrane metalloprotease [bacterium]
MNILLIGILGLLPSIVWLLYYLKKDIHPEPKRMILRVFFLGMIMTIPAYYIQRAFYEIFSSLPLSPALFTFLFMFIGIAFLEEAIKYLTVRWGAIRSREIDEPIDIMIYMIVAALGFAALENMLYLRFFEEAGAQISHIFLLTVLRFFFSTFLHALLSGLLGYFLVLSYFYERLRWRFLFAGFGIVTVLHGVFNVYILRTGELSQFFVPILILLTLAILLAQAFSSVRRMKSVCVWTPPKHL